jgi:hypothetical protein
VVDCGEDAAELLQAILDCHGDTISSMIHRGQAFGRNRFCSGVADLAARLLHVLDVRLERHCERLRVAQATFH